MVRDSVRGTTGSGTIGPPIV